MSTSEAQKEQRLNYYLPEYDFFERHSIVVNSSPEKVYKAINNSNMSESKIIGFLSYLRAIFEPSILKKDLADLKNTPGSQLIKGNEFMILLEEIENREIVLGFAGKFWHPRPKLIHFTNALEFISFNESGNGKAAWNMYIESNNNGTVTLSTETRILSLGGEAKLFRFYWAIIRLFSGWIRLELLKIIKKEAEK